MVNEFEASDTCRNIRGSGACTTEILRRICWGFNKIFEITLSCKLKTRKELLITLENFLKELSKNSRDEHSEFTANIR